ncbi:MAG: hypothetical protein V4521_00535 [Pseudomonadota bacterium]
MRWSLLITLAAVGAFVPAHAEQGTPAATEALKASFERKFEIAGCNPKRAKCSLSALALPSPHPSEPKTCLKSVLPDVVYERDGRGALGVDFTVSASIVKQGSGSNPAFEKLGDFPAVMVTETEGLQDFCFPNNLKIGPEIIRLRLRYEPFEFETESTSFSGVLAGLLNNGPSPALVAAAAGVKFRALPESMIVSLLGETSTGVVYVSVHSTKPKQLVKVGNRIIGKTDIPTFAMAKASLKKLTIGQSATQVISKACAAFSAGIEYTFVC